MTSISEAPNDEAEAELGSKSFGAGERAIMSKKRLTTSAAIGKFSNKLNVLGALEGARSAPYSKCSYASSVVSCN